MTRDSDEQPIVDLPLFQEADAGESAPSEEPTEAPAAAPIGSPDDGATRPVDEVTRPVAEAAPAHGGPASLTNRLGAALLDLAVMASAAVALLAGAMLLGVPPTIADWPAFVVPWLAFSFLYHVVPLAFWGRTPGMASMGLSARHVNGGGLSFGQAIRRWLANMFTVALCGLPGLLALTGRSTTDRASASVTLWTSH